MSVALSLLAMWPVPLPCQGPIRLSKGQTCPQRASWGWICKWHLLWEVGDGSHALEWLWICSLTWFRWKPQGGAAKKQNQTEPSREAGEVEADPGTAATSPNPGISCAKKYPWFTELRPSLFVNWFLPFLTILDFV